MKLSRLALGLRRLRFRNQELVFQSLYKAQNLGFYPNIYQDDLIERYAETVATADAYASAGSFRRARRVLGNIDWHGRAADLLSGEKTSVVLSAPSNLAVLALIAEAHGRGWHLVIEDGPFAHRFLQPVARRDGKRTEFHPFHLIPRLIRDAAGGKSPVSSLYVTFPDRPFDSIRGSIPVRLLGGDYLLSIAEALLTRAPVDRVLWLAGGLVEVDHPPGGTATISGEEIRQLVQAQAQALEEAILAAPVAYLGWESLYSRSQLFFDVLTANRRSVFECLLRHCQLNGMALPPPVYAGLLGQLSQRQARPVPA